MRIKMRPILINLLFLNFITADDVGDKCTPNEKVTYGVCTMINNCEPAVRALKNQKFHEFERCGFKGFQEIVCCPVTTDKFGETPNTNSIGSQRIADRECEKIMQARIPPLDLHILGGESASLGEFPHMVSLGFDRGEGFVFECGASLVSNRYAITAAHCVDTLDRIEPSIARTGVVDLGGNTWDERTDVRIAEIIKHPNYTRREKYHDLTLLRLERAVVFTSSLNAICLDTSNTDPVLPLTITGWGKTSNTRNTKSNMLLKANVTIVSREKCSESYTNWRKLPQGISDDQICAGDPEGIRDTCQGDSGGPLQATRGGGWGASGGAGAGGGGGGEGSREGQYVLVGVTSFGRGCGSPVPGVYTRISRYLDWIESVVWTD